MSTVTNGAVHPCCADSSNLRVLEHNEKLTTRQCGVCGRKHYVAYCVGLDLRPQGTRLGG